MEKYQEEYDKLLAREKKAVNWLDSPERAPGEIEKHLPNYENILDNLNMLISKHNISGKEILQGFTEVNS
ncbi:hypothetical protein SAMN02745751_03167 [Dethiosulfatibacter aminovorans DSM 17477]|uniref:Uncharacterized protein n=1 Tax=Dethiosulfatibacter aminovorans DSM 17477 TaxID=1121476 RepID=A0A1M6LGN1_9FIRM|nr:hypothetical protein [Dethiosulfatibacter aminovorans]SHJ70347.1 hypothetical protein SAMN02745751_03167 [Dethiosulfatibacter aminovorans DSM 17477]